MIRSQYGKQDAFKNALGLIKGIISYLNKIIAIRMK